jgi:glycine dehydrogenase
MFNSFVKRHLGSSDAHIQAMLSELGLTSLDELSTTVVPENILTKRSSNFLPKKSEPETINRLQEFARMNSVFRSYIGMGYYGTIVPAVIKRNILENPGWYTSYTPYQAEISQGRLEALLNFQTMVSDLTGLPLANSSLLDEGTAAAEAMLMFFNATRDPNKKTFLVSSKSHPQTIDILKTRSEPLGIELIISDHSRFEFNESVFGVLIQYPDTDGFIQDYSDLCDSAQKINLTYAWLRIFWR